MSAIDRFLAPLYDPEVLRQKITALDATNQRDPTVANIRELAPQLTESEAAVLLADLEPRERRYFSGPPTLVRGVFHRYVVMRTDKGQRLVYRAYPVNCATARDLSLDNDYATMLQMVDALPVPLLRDTGSAVFVAQLLQPSRRRAFPHVACSLSRTWSHITTLDQEPLGEAVNDAIIGMASADHEIDELTRSVAADPIWAYYCGFCGGNISSNRCTTCRHEYPTEVARPETPATLPYLVAGYLMGECQHVFTQDPQIARLRENRRWADERLLAINATKPQEDPGYGKAGRRLQLEDK